MSEPLRILKFGGAAVASCEAFDHIAGHIARDALHEQLVVVVSAMGDMTDRLIAMAHAVNSAPPQREMDMLVSVGERISIALLAMALAKRGVEAVSFTGSQSGILTTPEHSEARIIDVRPVRLRQELKTGKVVIVAGFQGVSAATKEITTLGRGGSDTTAVALGVALGARAVAFYKDVGAIFDRDPKRYADARPHRQLTYAQALDIVQATDHPVLHPRALQLAHRNVLPLQVLPFSGARDLGTCILCEHQSATSSPSYESL